MSTIDRDILEYEFDEEEGFEEPYKAAEAGLSYGSRISLAVLVFGILMLTLQLLGLFSLSGTWTGFLLSYLPISAGLSFYFWLSFRDTTPGIKHDNLVFRNITARGLAAWLLGVALTGFYVVLYWWPVHIESAVETVAPLSYMLTGAPPDQWFYYGFLYSLAVLVFGVRMFMKYRHSTYHKIRTFSLIFVQLGFAFILPQLMKLFNQPEFYFSYFWPLKFDYLFPSTVDSIVSHPGGLGIFFIFWGIALSFVATPVLTYFYGKRWYCSWVCGCGALAETLGDPWRQLSDKSLFSWKFERWIVHSILVFVTVVTLLLWINSFTAGMVFGNLSGTLASWYGFFIGAIFAGVIGVGFYPLLGSRVWCRFGCPLAAILGIIQRFFSRFRITTNGGQCMSCGNCSTFCEMGINVKAYAQEGKNIIRASCVGCGVCASVCPRGVLKLENGSSHGDRFDGADDPVQAFIDSIKRY